MLPPSPPDNPHLSGTVVAADFFAPSLQPTLQDQSPNVPADADPFWLRTLHGLGRTFVYALIALSLAVPAAFILGFFASRAWWPALPVGRSPTVFLRTLRAVLFLGFVATRILIAFIRSIHELLWATLFLAALGDFPFAACVALALPFAGTLAKVFAEIIDETPVDAKFALSASGASAPQSFFAALFPKALPDLFTYSLYRLECAVRSAAVLGFIGIETIGLYIHRSFENYYYREVWTELYMLLFAVIALDTWSAAVRKRLNAPVQNSADSDEDPPPESPGRSPQTIAALRRSRPRSAFVRISIYALALSVVASWWFALKVSDRPLFGNVSWEKRVENLGRFSKKLTPSPVRKSGNWEDAGPWIKKLWSEKGSTATVNTLAISIAAILIAAASTLVFLPLASRVLARPRPYHLAGRAPPFASKVVWYGVGGLTRFGFVISRAIPEYIFAFLFIALFGPTPWALIFALALHNFGILGRLWGEAIENSPPATPRQLTSMGAGRAQVFFAAVFPHTFGRFLLFLFYRWETCVRDAVVLGFIAVPTLGYYINYERHFGRYDTTFALVLIGSILVIIGDLTSDILRRWLRNI